MFSKVKLFVCINIKCLDACSDAQIEELMSENEGESAEICSVALWKKEWQETVLNTDMQLKSDLDEKRKFKY